MQISRTWAMPNRYTFSLTCVRELLLKYEVGDLWCDPFSGRNIVTEFENNLAVTKVDASEYLKKFENNSLRGVLFDPPYSMEQIKRSYNSVGIEDWQSRFGDNKTGGFSLVKNQIADIIKPNGLCISFGWNSNGLGEKRGFEIIEILLVAHGGNHNDTIITVEKKFNQALLF